MVIALSHSGGSRVWPLNINEAATAFLGPEANHGEERPDLYLVRVLGLGLKVSRKPFPCPWTWQMATPVVPSCSCSSFFGLQGYGNTPRTNGVLCTIHECGAVRSLDLEVGSTAKVLGFHVRKAEWWTFVSCTVFIMINPVGVVRGVLPFTSAQAVFPLFGWLFRNMTRLTRTVVAVGLSKRVYDWSVSTTTCVPPVPPTRILDRFPPGTMR